MELCAVGGKRKKGQPFVEKLKHGVDACYCMDRFKLTQYRENTSYKVNL
jgi:hypothetical protein